MDDSIWPLSASLLLGRYRPRALLARGSNSLVFEGTDETLGRAVAIKVFDAGADLERYQQELRLLAGLSHHGVVSIVDAGIDLSTLADPRPFLVMQLIRGATLHDTLRQGALTLRQSAEIGYEVAEALDYVHSQGVIHRDITPWNVMLTNYGSVASRSRARITDFGIAVTEPSALPTGTATSPAPPTVGTAAYLSPEQATGGVLTSATDVYSLGMVMLECYTESIAFPGGAEESVARAYPSSPMSKSIPRQWRGLLTRMTSARPFDRPTAAEVAAEIREILRSTSR